VSKDDGSQTIENQRPEVMQMALGRGFDVEPSHVFEDGASGAKGDRDRPGLAALLTSAARGKFRVVFVWAYDRISRDDTFYGGLLMIGELDRFNVGIVSHQEPHIDSAGPFRNALVSISVTLAAQERKKLIERTKRGIERARRDGTRSGKPIGRPRTPASDELLEAAAAHRRRTGGLDGWRVIARSMRLRGFANVPHGMTLGRLCTKRFPDLPRGTSRRPRG
jgi:DNA invertase Pin-like site-specific DNA recombinase